MSVEPPNAPHDISAILQTAVSGAFSAFEESKLAVAVSGGGDSVALLRLMHGFAKQSGKTLYAVTVDHGLRAEAADEAAFVAETCSALGVEHTTLEWRGWQGIGNLQDNARRARYHLISEWAAQRGISAVALAHTLDDQAETFLMRLSRAAGVDGLSGMQAVRSEGRLSWFRPLLSVSRADLRAYLKDIGQGWVEDPSNEDSKYERVRARQVLSVLAPLGIDAAVLGRVSDQLQDARAALAHATLSHAQLCTTQEAGDLVIDRASFADAPIEIKRRLTLHALRWISSADYGPRSHKLAEFVSAIEEGRAATLHGVRLIPGLGWSRLTREFAAVSELHADIGDIWDSRWRVKSESLQGLEVRALGEDGLRQLADMAKSCTVPRASLKASPAVFEGQTLRAAPLAGFGEAEVELLGGAKGFFSSLLSH